MAQLLVLVLSWAIWWGGLVAIIKIDQRRLDAAARVRGEENFMDKSVLGYLALGLLCGGLVLPIYFWTSRRRPSAAIIGVGLALALAFVVGLVQWLGGLLT